MIPKEQLKEIITSNRGFILNQVSAVIPREGIVYSQRLKKAVVLYGVRRSGKTFILYDLFKRSADHSLYIDFEDERLAGFELNDFESLEEAFLELNPQLVDKKKCFFLDEVQNIPGWERFCRRAVEKGNTEVFVTGSSSKIMPREIHTSLRGRAWSIEIDTFSFKEYLKAKTIGSSNDVIYGSKKAILKRHFVEYLKWGGFPEVVFAETEFEKIKILKEYFGSLFFKDLVERFQINNIPLLDLMTHTIFAAFSQKLSLTAFYKQFKTTMPFSKDSLFSYYKYFLQSMLTFEVRKFSRSVYRRMRNPAKVYLVDTGLAKKVTPADQGRLLENLVFLELRRRTDQIFYFEENRECDFVAETRGKLSLYQVCFELNQTSREREIEGLLDGCKQLGLREGCILTFDQEEEFSKDRVKIKVVPAWKWILTAPKDAGIQVYGHH